MFCKQKQPSTIAGQQLDWVAFDLSRSNATNLQDFKLEGNQHKSYYNDDIY